MKSEGEMKRGGEEKGDGWDGLRKEQLVEEGIGRKRDRKEERKEEKNTC